MSRTILPPTLCFTRRTSRSHHDYVNKIVHLIEYDTYEASTYYVWNGITYGNTIVFHRRTSDGALFINEPVVLPQQENIWQNVTFMPSMEALYDFKVYMDTPHPRDEVAARAAQERPAFTKDVIRTLLAKPLPPADV